MYIYCFFFFFSDIIQKWALNRKRIDKTEQILAWLYTTMSVYGITYADGLTLIIGKSAHAANPTN